MEVSERVKIQARGEALIIQGCCAMSKASICDLNACLLKYFGGSNLNNTAAGPPGFLSQCLCISLRRGR